MDSTERFSSRVADYVKYRPGYPPALVEALRQQAALRPDAVIADVGSGTGILTKLFLEEGYQVHGVEPNAAMRQAAESWLQPFPKFASINGTAEATTLPSASIDLITAGQAFHWFNRPLARQEFQRIGRPPGWVALIWNERLTDASAFLRDYESLLKRLATDYASVDHRNMTDDVIAEFFSPASFALRVFPNRQIFDEEGLKGRLLSSSYVPQAGQPGHEAILAEVARIFARHQSAGRVVVEYETKSYLGKVRG